MSAGGEKKRFFFLLVPVVRLVLLVLLLGWLVGGWVGGQVGGWVGGGGAGARWLWFLMVEAMFGEFFCLCKLILIAIFHNDIETQSL